MSLLLQALQKAAQNRDSAPGPAEPAPSSAAAQPRQAAPQQVADLSYEPEREEPDAPQTELALADADVFGPEDTEARAEPFEPFDTPSAAATSAQAAMFLRASETRSAGWVDWVRDHPVPVFAVAAGIFLLFYSVYVYLEIFHPGALRGDLFTQALTAKTPPAAPVRPSNPSAPVVNAAGTGPSPGAVPPPTAAPSAASPPALASAPAGQELRSAPGPTPTPSVHVGAQPGTPAEGQVPPSPASAMAPRAAPTDSVASRVAPAPSAAAGPAAAATPVETAPMTDVVGPRRTEPTPAKMPPQRLIQAYQALQDGKLDEAEALYRESAQADPDSVDAMLGLAAIAAHRGHVQQAVGFYDRALELEPRNAVAQAGLIDILGQADPATSESKLKQLIAREPSAYLYFSLGNFYARQGLWPRAQAAYFEAYQMQSDNADYAYDLAVGLEHLNQPKLALAYYRKALELSLQQSHANFDQKRVIERIGQLAARVE